MTLRELRISKDLTMREISMRCGISESTYCMIEHGKRTPSVKTAKKIAEVLGFDWTAFF